MTAIHLIVLAATALLPLLLSLLNLRTNRRREQRQRQALRPWLGLAYTAACCALFSWVSRAGQWVLGLSFLQPFVTWVQNTSGLVYGLELYTALLLNLLVIGGFIALKGVLFGTAGAFERLSLRLRRRRGETVEEEEDAAAVAVRWQNRRGLRRLWMNYQNIFYDMESGPVTVRRSWVGAGRTLQYAARILLGAYVALLVLMQLPLLNGFSLIPEATARQILENLYLWPAVSMAALWELVFFLDGREENHLPDPQEIFVDEVKSRREADYSHLAGEFRNLFPERFVTDLRAPTFPREARDIAPESPVAQEILRRMRRWNQDHPISADIMDCVASLPDRQNAVIDAALSSQFGECLTLYLNVLLSRGENLLVLCENEDACDQIRDYIREELRRVNTFAPVWIVESVREAYASGDCDVLVLTPQAVLDGRITDAKRRLYENLTTVLMVDTSRIISEMGSLMTVVSNVLAQGRGIQYICLCNGIPGELRGTLSQILSPGADFRPWECFRSDENTHIMLWNYEASGDTRPTAQSRLFGAAMDHVYLGVALPLACVAVKYDVPGVSVMAQHLPARQLRDAMLADFSKTAGFFDRSLRAEAFWARLRFNRIDSENPFVIVEDETRNLPMTLRNYCRYIGRQTAMVHVVSKPYLLRDYFAAFAGEYLADHRKSESLAPMLMDSDKITVIKLIAEAAGPDGLTEDRLMRRAAALNHGPLPLREALQLCYTRALNGEPAQDIENVFQVSTRSDYVSEKRDFVTQRVIRLKDAALLERLIGDIHPAVVRAGDREYLLGIGRRDIFRYYLPNQAIAVQNAMYYIDAIDPASGVLYAGRMLETLGQPLDYVQHRVYGVELKGARTQYSVQVDLRSQKAAELFARGYRAELLRSARVTVDTLGYFTPRYTDAAPDLTDKSGYRALNQAERAQARRTLERASVLSLSFTGMEEETASGVAFTLAVLLSEAMKTLFPYTWPCLAVCPMLPRPISVEPDDILGENLTMAYPQAYSAESIPADGAQILIIEDSENDTGILDTLFRDRRTPLSALFSLLLGYLDWQQDFFGAGNIRGDYLHFGADDPHPLLKLDETRRLLRQLELAPPSEKTQTEEPEPAEVCYFCHCSLHLREHVALYGEGGKKDRLVCSDCAKRLLTSRSQLEPLYQRARQYLEGTFGITLPQHLHVKFTTAEKMAKKLKKRNKKQRIIGLAESLTKTVYVEIASPEEHVLATLVHELTHFWQFENLEFKDMDAMEGHASYLEVQYMRELGYTKLASELHSSLMHRQDDPYGRGYARLRDAMKTRPDGNTFTYMLSQYGKKRKK